MDLNASPLPDEDEDYREHYEDERAMGEHIETSVETMRREREERRRRLQREYSDEGSKRALQRNNNIYNNHRPPKRAKTLPQGWLDCPPCGQNIGCIIPSKVPLDESFNDAVPPGRRYSSKQVIQQQRRQGREIGLVVDLTNTTRYYSPSEYQRQGIKHLKIACKGRDSVPDNESVNKFCFEVSQFLIRQKAVKKYVLVHCTHGHNRTGYMIINYLMRTQPTYLTEAIQEFSRVRPPGIYKQDYIEALYMFYHERKPENMICPSTPEWKRPSDLDLNGEAVQDDDGEDGATTPPRQDIPTENQMTNDDVLGDAIPPDQQQALQAHCLWLLKSQGGRGTQFPGSHPVSLNSDNLQLLRQRYYYATWKADGTRYMMLITVHGCYLIDRNFSFRRVQLRFPLKSTNEGLQGLHSFTLIDGEMIIDSVPDGPDSKKLERRYLAYDLMVLNSESVIERPFSERWKLLEKEVIEPRNMDKRQNHIYRYDMEPFRVRRKDFWLLSTVSKLLREFIPKLSHDADGLIFQGWDDPYVMRTHDGLLKWKYADMNSVDFLFEVDSENRQQLYLFERGKKKRMEDARVSFRDEEDISGFAGKIIECSWSSEEDSWVYMRIRTDKSTPNDINTYRKVVRSIKDNITDERLLEEINEIVQLPMYADRIMRAQSMQHAHIVKRR